MMLGLGDTTTPAATTPTTTTPTFGSGLSLWTSPTSAFTAIGTLMASPSTAFSGAILPFTLGVLLPPIALVAVLMSMGGGRGKH